VWRFLGKKGYHQGGMPSLAKQLSAGGLMKQEGRAEIVLKSRLRDEPLIASHTKAGGSCDGADARSLFREQKRVSRTTYVHKGSLNDCFNYYCMHALSQQQSLSFHLRPAIYASRAAFFHHYFVHNVLASSKLRRKLHFLEQLEYDRSFFPPN